MPATPSRYQIVQRRSARRWPWVVAVGAIWLLSLGLTWQWAGIRAAPGLAEATARMRSAEGQLAAQQARLKQLSQRETTLAVSDKISRDANGDLQGALAERKKFPLCAPMWRSTNAW